jgi:hypothetical protein
VSVLPLPATLAEMRDISFSEALALLDRLRAFFDLQVVDLGGFSNAEFMAQIVKAADTVVLVAEQSVGAIVSAAELLQELKKREVERDDLHLLVSRFDAELGWMRNRSPSGSAWPRWARCPTGAPRCCRPPIVARCWLTTHRRTPMCAPSACCWNDWDTAPGSARAQRPGPDQGKVARGAAPVRAQGRN